MTNYYRARPVLPPQPEPLASSALGVFFFGIAWSAVGRFLGGGLLSDVVVSLSMLSATVLAVVALVRILTSGGQRTGLVKSISVLILTALIFAIAVPNFIRARNRARECRVLAPLVQEYVTQSKALESAVTTKTGQPDAIQHLLQSQADFILAWRIRLAPAETGPIMGPLATGFGDAAADTGRLYGEMASAIRTGDGARVRSLQPAIQQSEQRLQDELSLIGTVCR